MVLLPIRMADSDIVSGSELEDVEAGKTTGARGPLDDTGGRIECRFDEELAEAPAPAPGGADMARD